MKAIIQRVNHASVRVAWNIVGKIEHGLLVFFGVSSGDNEMDAEKILKKILNVRIFRDENEKMNLSVKDINGEILSVSQFTLCANCKKWNRPSFTNAENPEIAKKMWEFCNKKIRTELGKVETGIFGADMKIELENDGPVTIILDSKVL